MVTPKIRNTVELDTPQTKEGATPTDARTVQTINKSVDNTNLSMDLTLSTSTTVRTPAETHVVQTSTQETSTKDTNLATSDIDSSQIKTTLDRAVLNEDIEEPDDLDLVEINEAAD